MLMLVHSSHLASILRKEIEGTLSTQVSLIQNPESIMNDNSNPVSQPSDIQPVGPDCGITRCSTRSLVKVSTSHEFLLSGMSNYQFLIFLSEGMMKQTTYKTKSDYDVSGIPLPYRILRQWLFAPGTLDGYSFYRQASTAQAMVREESTFSKFSVCVTYYGSRQCQSTIFMIRRAHCTYIQLTTTKKFLSKCKPWW